VFQQNPCCCDCSCLQVELLLHAILLYDRLPPLCLAVGFATHLSYLRLLKPFPYISLTSASGFTSLGLLLASSVLWVRHFMTTFYTGGLQVLGVDGRFATESCWLGRSSHDMHALHPSCCS
jgi:hypothetical protein